MVGMKKTDQVIKKIKSAPKNPGVYVFFRGRKPIYVGKANNLKNRLSYYLGEENQIRKEATRLWYKSLLSGVEALIIESSLIKKLNPDFNVLMRDDKSYFYVAITNDNFPRVFIIHNSGKKKFPNAKFIGPFTEGLALRGVLKSLRRKFPYCSCKSSHKRACLNSQIDNCLGFCCQKDFIVNSDMRRQYKKNINSIRAILLGKKKFIGDGLETIREHSEVVKESGNLAEIKFRRAECYDISHLSGKETVGAMTAWVKSGSEWVADKELWRKFKIKTASRSNDPEAIKEIVGRRLNHPEWPYPDIMIIDGGVTQLRAAKEAKLKVPSIPEGEIKIISFAKPNQLALGWKDEPTEVKDLPVELNKLIQKAIYYTHNFAIRYHRSRRQRQLLNSGV